MGALGIPKDRLDPQGVQVPCQGDLEPIGGEGNGVQVVPWMFKLFQDRITREIRDALLTLAGDLKTHFTRDIGRRMNALKSTTSSWLREFLSMNLPIFLGSNPV